MSDGIQELSGKEMRHLGFDIRPFSNPFRSVKSRIMRSTKDNQALRNQALRTALVNSYELKQSALYLVCTFISTVASLGLFEDSLWPYKMISLGSMAAFFGLLLTSFLRGDLLENGIVVPYLQCNPRRTRADYITRWQELDALLDLMTVDTEETLLANGMTLQELKSLVELAENLVEHKAGMRNMSQGMLSIETTQHISPKALELVDKAMLILQPSRIQGDGDGTVVRIAPPQATLSTTLEHMGIPVHR